MPVVELPGLQRSHFRLGPWHSTAAGGPRPGGLLCFFALAPEGFSYASELKSAYMAVVFLNIGNGKSHKDFCSCCPQGAKVCRDGRGRIAGPTQIIFRHSQKRAMMCKSSQVF